MVYSKGKYHRELLAKYITYAREYVTPRISEIAGRRLSATYLDMRKVGNSKKMITATPRQLESLIRISEAFAKMRLSIEVNENDVERAVQLVRVAMQQAATDPETGLIDMDAILIGKTAKSRERVSRLKTAI
jgi:DNA replication licensing factor MCM4